MPSQAHVVLGRLLACTRLEMTRQSSLESHAMPPAVGDGRGGGIVVVMIRVATWNLDRPSPRGWKVPPAQRRRMAAVDADIWVLTETHVDMQPSPAHTAVVYSPPHPERRASHERWTAIWSRWPLNLIDDPAPHRRGTVAAVVQHPTEPFIVYGTVIAWANERHHDDGSPAGMWEVHLAEIARQGAEWRRLRSELPDLPLIVAGDFNQSQDDSNWYGTRFGRTRVREMLAASELRCHTTMDAVAHGLLTDQHLVDHICTTAELGAPTIRCLPRTDGEGQRLSDHPTVIADFPTMRPQAH